MFKFFNAAIKQQTDELLKEMFLFSVDIDKDRLYELYLDSFPAGANEIFRERREHDCSACKQFIRQFGGVVAIRQNKVISVWDIVQDDNDVLGPVSEIYAPVVKALSEYVKSCAIKDVFRCSQSNIGIESNVEQLPDGTIKRWEHLHAVLPSRFVTVAGQSVGDAVGKYRDGKNVLKRALDELTLEAFETVLDLISQNSLYRGTEFKALLDKFLVVREAYVELPNEQQDIFCWLQSTTLPDPVCRIRNSSIGTLLIDLSAGVDLNAAVRRFESVVAPTNYKRPKAIFSKKMVEQAQATIEDLGLTHSLPRRFATVEDITANNILFANTDTMRSIVPDDVFSELKESVPATVSKFDSVEEIPVEKFIKDVLPRLDDIEVLLENKHKGNLVSLIAPMDSSAPSLFKWSNAFSWAYSGNVTDSMKELVKSRGGNVGGVLRFSIQWNEEGDNQNDFDAHSREPGGNLIYYPNKRTRQPSSGMLDVDIIDPEDTIAVENICYSNLSAMPLGVYKFITHCYSSRGGTSGFRAEIEFDGQVHEFGFNQACCHKQSIPVADVTLCADGTFSIKSHLPSSLSSRSMWGKSTQNFHPVSVMMFSPNYWDEQEGNGNRHYFFMIDGLKNEDSPNGFFNEFLKNDLLEHKRVFEALGGKMKPQGSAEKQLSGLGFSSTKRETVTCRIKGASTQRVVKIKF